MSKPSRTTDGFTLIEAIVVTFVFSVLAYGIAALVSSMLVNSGRQGASLYNADQARRVSFQVMAELRNATTSNTGAYAILTAQDQALTFYTNLDGGTDVERVRYFISGTNLRKGTLKPTGNPLTYNVANEVVTTVQTDVANGANPLFYYYDGTYTGATDNYLAQPVDVTDARYVRMRLSVTNRGGAKGTGNYSVTAAGTIRNLKDNLDD